jgi:hypothetical protein
MTALRMEYEALWRHIEADGVYVWYGISQRGESGYFQHDGKPIRGPDGSWESGPLVGVCREHSTTPDTRPSDRDDNGTQVDLANELFTLAHEYGHCLSFRGRTAQQVWQAYHRAAIRRDELYDSIPNGGDVPSVLSAGLSDDEKALIIAEEALAWRLGHALVPIDLLASYDACAKHHVNNHRLRMGMGVRGLNDGLA